MDEWREKWGSISGKIRKIDELRRRAEEDQSIDLEKSINFLQGGLEENIKDALVRLETFLREVIRQGEDS